MIALFVGDDTKIKTQTLINSVCYEGLTAPGFLGVIQKQCCGSAMTLFTNRAGTNMIKKLSHFPLPHPCLGDAASSVILQQGGNFGAFLMLG